MAIQSGNKEVSGELTVYQSELQGLQDIAKAAKVDLTEMSFDVVVSYANGNDYTTDIIKGVELTEFEKGMKQGDSNMETSLKFAALKIQYGV